MKHQVYRQAAFLTSAAALKQLPADIGAEVAFVGRSNAGKSSALNTITHQKQLARISKTPGRTQLINVFSLDDTHRLIDLPGYGFAKVPEEVKQRWQHLLSEYLKQRESLQGIMLLVDCRLPLKDSDWQMIQWAHYQNLRVHVLLTKADKLRSGAQKAALHSLTAELASFGELVTCQLFSSLKGIGLDDVYRKLNEWLFISPKPIDSEDELE